MARVVLGWAAVWLIAVVLVQALVAIAPGDAIDTLPDPALRAQLAVDWGLAQPAWRRVLDGTVNAMVGAWGTSWTVRPGSEVAPLIAQGLWASAPVGLGAWGVALAVGLGARGRGAPVLVLVSAVPVVLLTVGLIEGVNAGVWEGMTRGWWQRPGFFALPTEAGPVRDALLILALGLGSGVAGEVAARLAEADATLIKAGFVLARRARGQPVAGLLWRHRVVPLLEAAQAAFGPTVGGLVIVERLFARPGLGDLLWRAVEGRDVPVATGVVLAVAGATVLLSAGVDLGRRAWDPRLGGAS